MKKKAITIIILVLLILVATVTIISVLLSKNKMMLSTSRDKITKVVITNGNNGDVTELSSDNIDKLYAQLSNTKIKKISKENTSGWLYKIDVCGDDTVISISIISNEKCIISGDRYSIEEKKGNDIISVIEGF